MSPMDDAQPIESQVSATETPPLSEAELNALKSPGAGTKKAKKADEAE